jgi:hypothetical protein
MVHVQHRPALTFVTPTQYPIILTVVLSPSEATEQQRTTCVRAQSDPVRAVMADTCRMATALRLYVCISSPWAI